MTQDDFDARSISRRRFLEGSAAVLAAGGLGSFLAACGGDDEAAEQTRAGAEAGPPVKVGAILDASGPLQFYGETMVNATRFAINSINKNGGVLGRQLQLRLIDSQSDQSLYTSGARELANDKDIAVVLGAIISASREAIRPIFYRAKKLYLYAPIYEGGVCDKYTFCTGITPTQQSQALMPYLVKKYGRRFYTVAADYEAGQIGALWAREYAKTDNLNIVGEEFFPLDVSDFGATIQKIQEARPDFVLSILVGADHLAFYRAYTATGLKQSIPIGSTTLGYGNEQTALPPAVADGLITCLNFYEEVDTPTAKEFVRDFRAAYPKTDYVGEAISATWLAWQYWARGVEKAGTFDQAAVIKALESGIEIDNAPEGPVSMVGSAHHSTHNVRIAAMNRKRGYDILATYNDMKPTWEIESCNLIENPNQSKQNVPS